MSEADARSSLAAHGWEVNAALDALLTGAALCIYIYIYIYI